MLSTPNEFSIEHLSVKIFPTVEEMGAAAAGDVAAKIVELLERQPVVNIIFAAAPSQDEFLKRLVAFERIEWQRINAFHMDEYIGLSPTAPQSFGNYLRRMIFDRVPFRTVNYINGSAPDIEKECERYSRLLLNHPPDIACLGIGENGHIAFNDPDVADFDDPETVKVVTLDQTCRQQQVNEKCFDTLSDVPATAMTITIPALLKAGRTFCVVPFKNKAEAVFNTLYGKVSERCPATVLRRKENSLLYLNGDSAQLIANMQTL
jgi:glucosamine-6-phosphate deaminase